MVCSLLRQPLNGVPQESALSGEALIGRYEQIRGGTEKLIQPLSAEDCCVQSMPDASPTKWHLAHTTWFFETFVLERFDPLHQPYDAGFRHLFNSYYNSVGIMYARPERGLLTRPALDEILNYRHRIDARMKALLHAHGECPALQDLVLLGLHHEQQHQELILTDIKHLFSRNPSCPVYRACVARTAEARGAPMTWVDCEGGIAHIGAVGPGFCFDNERPRHGVLLRPYRLASRPVTNAEYREFIADGAYENPAPWLSDGWDWVRTNRIRHPLYWIDAEGGGEFTLHGSRALAPEEPMVHVAYYEADAFARWAGARLPTEAEWESAAQACGTDGHFADTDRLHPRAAGGTGLQDMFGNVWEWTASAYSPYPGYRSEPGALGEYNGKFMANQYVLRGGSCATPAGHVRASYRNFFPASARWQFSGIRLARDGVG